MICHTEILIVFKINKIVPENNQLKPIMMMPRDHEENANIRSHSVKEADETVC
jgi:hypothetical protein